MAKLPVISGQAAIRVFKRLGYTVDRQRGSHVMMRAPEPPHRRLSVPNHKVLRPGTLRTLIADADLSVEEFVRLLRN
jgi:predicted RNA binding protein YcfA (HicA-like mRNA interferase family)